MSELDIINSGLAPSSTLTVDDLQEVTEYLKDLDDTDIKRLGLALGLSHRRLQKMTTLPEDMVLSWLRGDDNVSATSGTPSWSSFAKTLNKRGHTNISFKVREEKICCLSNLSATSPG